MRDWFTTDPDRFRRYSRDIDEIFFDFSKNRIDDQVLDSLLELARERDVEGLRDRMFSGEAINSTEGRAVLHVALRDASGAYRVGSEDVSSGIRSVNGRMASFVEAIHSGAWTGATGKSIRTIVNIGIGGSHLGPQAAATALAPYGKPDIDVRFVSNVDGHDLEGILAAVNPEETVFLIASKTFTTQETMTNASSARSWITGKLGDDAVSKHFAALSTNTEAVVSFGIDPDNIFEFWDWVGGRFSMWSAIGLSVALAIGWERFSEMLAGAHEMDQHFKHAALEENLPALMALVGVWNINFLGMKNLAILPYDQRLRILPAMLQQLDMESNGKRVGIDGETVDCATAPVVFGESGTNGQHSFHQLLHQGTVVIPADFIVIAEPAHDLGGHQEKLLSHALAQSQALMAGRTLEEADGNPHRVFPGNRPSNTIVLKRLDPSTVGKLIALYEHKVLVQGAIWGINSFDQWGVELGKELAGHLLSEMTGESGTKDKDSSTAGLMETLRSWRS